MKILIKKTSLFVLMSILLLVTACSEAAVTEDKKLTDGESSAEKNVVIGITNPPAVFNPLNLDNNTTRVITSILFSPLVELDDSFNWVPMLADSITTEDNKVYTVKLNSDAKWTDGEPLTVDDLIFTVKLIGNPAVTYSYSTHYSVLDGFDDTGKLIDVTNEEVPGLKKIDSQTVEYHLKKPLDEDTFKENFGRNFKILPEHVLKDINPENFDKDPFGREPTVFSGPFKFITYQKDQYVELAANKDYFKGAPKIDKLYFKVMPAANIVAQLESGEIQMNYPGIGNIDIQDIEKVEAMSNVRTIPGKPAGFQVLTYNVEVIPDRRVRHAILLAIDREMIVEKLYKGNAEIMDVLYPSSQPYFNKNLKPAAYDPEKAKQLLKEAGWDGNKTLQFVVPSGNKTREQAADIIVQNLRDVGVKAQVQKFDIATVVQKFSNHDFDLTFFGFQYEMDPDLSSYLKTGAGYNASGYSSPEMDRLLEEGLGEVNIDKRKEIYNEIQELLVSDKPMSGLFADMPIGAVSKNIIGAEPKSVGMLVNVHEWNMED